MGDELFFFSLFMHAFFIISYNRKYHNIEWLKLSFSRFAHHLSKSRVLIRPPPLYSWAGQKPLDLGWWCHLYQNMQTYGCFFADSLFHNLCQRMRTGLELKKKLLFSLHFQVTITHEILITVRVIFVLTATRIPTWQMCLIGLFLMLYLFQKNFQSL